MRDLAVLVPSRGRPDSVARLTEACAQTRGLDTQLCWAFDDDDPTLDASKANAGAGYIWQGPRDGLAGWTNRMWSDLKGEFRYYASLGDDHQPVTHGWDVQLCAVLDAKGGGFAYCDNGQPDPNFPEMCVITGGILDALGWMAHPSMLHYCIDVVWMELGQAADCLYYLPDVLIRHWNWALYPGHPGLRDDTYWEASEKGRLDVLAHEKWQQDGFAADVATVKGALGRG